MELQYLYSPDVTAEPHWLHNANSELYVCLFGEACHAVSPGKKLDFFFFFLHRTVPISRSVSLVSSGPHHWTNSTQGVFSSATAPFPLPEPATISLSFSCCADWHFALFLNAQLSVWDLKEQDTWAWHGHQEHRGEAPCWNGYMLEWSYVAPQSSVLCLTQHQFLYLYLVVFQISVTRFHFKASGCGLNWNIKYRPLICGFWLRWFSLN